MCGGGILPFGGGGDGCCCRRPFCCILDALDCRGHHETPFGVILKADSDLISLDSFIGSTGNSVTGESDALGVITFALCDVAAISSLSDRIEDEVEECFCDPCCRCD
jgi:hypothetical protein